MSMPGSVIEDEILLRILIESQKANKNLKDLDGNLKYTNTLLESLLYWTTRNSAQMDRMGSSAHRASSGVQKMGGGLFSLTNIARTALGTLEAMAIFLIARFVGQAITKSIDSLKQLELSFYKLSIAEASLSKSGVNITPKELVAIANELDTAYNFISKIDATKIVGQVALLTKDLGLTKDQIRELSMAIPALARSTGESIEETTAAIATGIAKNGRGLADQNVQVNAQIIQDKVLELQLVKNKEAYDNLTAAQKQQVDVSALVVLISEASNDAMEKQGELAGSLTETQGKLNESWENLTTDAGVKMFPQLISGLEFLIRLVDALRLGVEALRFTFIAVGSVAAGIIAVYDAAASHSISNLEDAKAIFDSTRFDKIKELYDATSGPKIGSDTPTIISPEGIEENSEDVVGAIEKMAEEIKDAQMKLEQDLLDAAIDLARKLEDIGTEYAHKRRDINSDSNEKIAELEANAHDNQLQKEAEFQNKLLEMRERFLMDLDEALHARDARQILRLIKQYNLEKTQAIRKHELDRAEDEREIERKVQAARREQAQRLADLKVAEERERRAAILAFERRKQDLARAMRDRLALMAAGLVSQFNLTKTGLDAILKLFQQYFGSGGYVDQVYAGMAQRVPAANISMSAPKSSGGGGSGMRYADGGTMIADRPTSAVFGDKGLEMATFTPLNGNRTSNPLFSNFSGKGDGADGGKVAIELFLSPDLEARILKNTMNSAASIVTKVSRSK